ncbi:23S rRNA (guanosine(2251)-2'-O)-methyltransferase protein [Dioscorea alata]|uniref:23S rRNA (Guanosine(2251)-2'-O)-methyltransferase protein n=2 Tax=Dioscorea alata TaxID=55571 RepID=A0ACB7WF15_DIOAL|nr:23S rRNA (guanosine(2251)-2'-O)-methyltransferase protein [Dioscorea alata]KAH7686370.1 23S rRNA (guanosine(2251)-2'-O)-methyltransferase protein [Dioscorea alata]
MFSFNLAKTPLFSRVSRPPSFHSRSPSSPIRHWRTFGLCIDGLSPKPRDFSTDSPQRGARNSGKSLPWMATNRERESRREEKSSSWEASAERYFSRNGGKKLEEKLKKVEVEVVEPEDEEEESVDDSRWDRMRARYSRFERPEARRWNKQESWGRKMGKEAAESSVPKIVGQGVYGVGPVLAALSVKRRELYALYVQQGLDLSGNNRRKKDKRGVENVLKMAEEIGLKVVETSKHDLNMVVDNRPHQGLVLDASPLEMVSIRELEPMLVEDGRVPPLWVALDEVTDPQNLGAIVRSAYFFGAEGVVVCAKNSAPLSGVVSKASAGSLELIELRSCKNMMQFLTASAENGWRVLGGSVSSRAAPLCEIEVGVPTILVLGSEGTGLRPLVERSCTQLIRIPGNIREDVCAGESETEDAETDRAQSGHALKSFLAVESLNVSVATGVLLYHLIGRITNSNE